MKICSYRRLEGESEWEQMRQIVPSFVFSSFFPPPFPVGRFPWRSWNSQVSLHSTDSMCLDRIFLMLLSISFREENASQFPSVKIPPLFSFLLSSAYIFILSLDVFTLPSTPPYEQANLVYVSGGWLYAHHVT